ncbi:hypothetical protein [Brevibacillus daliensis]|uniref:hypothetical protein n=1 Tax=Brevibacillus daliensis TaxID=2892995 RepID=UPI001E548BF1|nr:hypothetical protein [Brevibacillus daliensis]
MYWMAWVIFFSYLITGMGAFLYLFKFRRLIGYHFGMNVAMTASGVFGLATGIVFSYLFPGEYTLLTIVTTVLAVAIGVVFGALVDYQTVITGVSSGVMPGLMGPMIGMMADQQVLLILFCTVLYYGSFGLLCYSVRA